MADAGCKSADLKIRLLLIGRALTLFCSQARTRNFDTRFANFNRGSIAAVKPRRPKNKPAACQAREGWSSGRCRKKCDGDAYFFISSFFMPSSPIASFFISSFFMPSLPITSFFISSFFMPSFFISSAASARNRR